MEKIIKLRKLLKNFDLDGYIIPKNNNFFGEYVTRSEDNLKYISNFSGSAGFAVILIYHSSWNSVWKRISNF